MWKSSIAVLCVSASAAWAQEIELSVYGGYQTAPHSRVTGARADGSVFSERIGWDGKSFSAPPYYGLRGTYWLASNWGYGVELTHAKVYAPATEMPAGFSRLEFTDGHNIVTLNALRRWPGLWHEKLTPYAGVGIGAAVPHVDVNENGNRTFGYQVTGPAFRAMLGASYALNERWALFGEYQFTASDNKADLEGGGSLNATILTNALNMGVSLKF